eukprot:30850-Pelagococcus_subviridis.AAC.6
MGGVQRRELHDVVRGDVRPGRFQHVLRPVQPRIAAARRLPRGDRRRFRRSAREPSESRRVPARVAAVLGHPRRLYRHRGAIALSERALARPFPLSHALREPRLVAAAVRHPARSIAAERDRREKIRFVPRETIERRRTHRTRRAYRFAASFVCARAVAAAAISGLQRAIRRGAVCGTSASERADQRKSKPVAVGRQIPDLESRNACSAVTAACTGCRASQVSRSSSDAMGGRSQGATRRRLCRRRPSLPRRPRPLDARRRSPAAAAAAARRRACQHRGQVQHPPAAAAAAAPLPFHPVQRRRRLRRRPGDVLHARGRVLLQVQRRRAGDERRGHRRPADDSVRRVRRFPRGPHVAPGGEHVHDGAVVGERRHRVPGAPRAVGLRDATRGAPDGQRGGLGRRGHAARVFAFVPGGGDDDDAERRQIPDRGVDGLAPRPADGH